MKIKSTRESINWLSKKSDLALKKLEKAEKKLNDYTKEKDIVTIEDRLTIIPHLISDYIKKKTNAETKRKDIEIVYKKLIEIKEDFSDAATIPVISNSPIFRSLQKQILKAEQKIMVLSNKFGEKHPVMIRAVTDLEILLEKRGDEIRRIIKYTKNQYELAKSKEDSTTQDLLDTKKKAIELNKNFIQYGILRKDIESNKLLYEALERKMKELTITEEVQSVNVNVIEVAKPPKIPISPNKKRNILLGLILGLFGGIGLAFFLEYLDGTIKSPVEIANRYGVNILGSIPYLKSSTKKIEEIVYNEPASSIAESYKNVRMSVLLSNIDNPPQTILMTSMSAMDGKSTTSVNLAVAIAQAEKNVLLIDSDLRRPRIHRIFDLSNNMGLSTLITGDSNASGIIQNGPLPNLKIITSGPLPISPSELLSSKRMVKIIEVLKSKFDIIIFDSPIMTVTDSLILSRILDGTIIVSRAGKTTYENLDEGFKALHNMKANILGMVINGVGHTSKDLYYYTDKLYG